MDMEVRSIRIFEMPKEFIKCGYIYSSPKIDNKSSFFLSCYECEAVFCQLENFVDHMFTHINPGEHENKETFLYKCPIEENISLEKESHMLQCENDGYEKDPLEDEMKNDQFAMNANIDHSAITLEFSESIKNENSSSDFDDVGDNDLKDNIGSEDNTCTDEESERDVSPGFHKNVETNKIMQYVRNRPLITCIIEAFKKETKLWDTKSETMSNSIKYECLKSIAQEVNRQFHINATVKQMDFIIKRLKKIFIQYRLKADINKNLYNKQLWFNEQLKFIEPHLQLKKQTLKLENFSEEQILLLIRLLRDNECLWNEENIYHTSVVYRQKIFKDILQNYSNFYELRYFTINDMKRIFKDLKEIVVNMNKQRLKWKNKTISNELGPKHRLYKNLEFLAPHVGPFICNDCGKVSLDIYCHKFHVSQHKGTKPFKCMVCHKELAHKKGFMCHLQRHTNECAFKCSLCEKCFPSRKEQQRHILKHGSKPYVCELCASTFFTQHQLTNHMKKHANIRDHICNQCGKGFTHRGLLRQHLLTHNRTDCVCSLCENVYANPRSLRKHYIRVHQSSQDFSYSPSQFCKICKISFATTLEAKWHRKEHRQSLPVKRKHCCDICGHEFAYPRNLADHKKTHSNVRDQVCDVCGKAFTNTNILKQHKKVHSAEKFNCMLCGNEYAHYRGLCRHMAKVHKSCVVDLNEGSADLTIVEDKS